MLCGAHACRSYLLVLQNVVGNAILLTTCARLIDESFRSTKYKGFGSPITSSQPLFKLRMRDLEGVWACFGWLYSLSKECSSMVFTKSNLPFGFRLAVQLLLCLLPTPDQPKRHWKFPTASMLDRWLFLVWGFDTLQGLTYIEVPCKVHIRTVTSLGRRFNLIKIVMGLEFVNCNNFLIKKCETWEELISNYRSTTVRYPSRPMSMPPNNEQSLKN